MKQDPSNKLHLPPLKKLIENLFKLHKEIPENLREDLYKSFFEKNKKIIESTQVTHSEIKKLVETHIKKSN